MSSSEHRSLFQAALADRYSLETEIGRGGMGIVYRARDNRHDRTVAIKFLREEISSSVGAARFNQEIRIEARLQHPNIVPVHEWAQADGMVFCVMPLIAGESLRERIRRERQLPVADAVQIARETLAALDYAHQQGIVHRDVKPENILLSSGHAMLTDFGVARIIGDAALDRLTASGLAVGTVSYMSPEQAAGDMEVGPRSDIYALGCVLYEMLAGDPPFGASTPQVVMARHIRDTPPPLDTVRPGISPALMETLQRALQKIPADRFSTASAFAASLDAVPPSGSGSTRLVTGSKRSRWIAGSVAVGAILIAGAVWNNYAGGPALDDRRVVVLPLESVNSGANAAAGWDAAIAISASLEHAEPLRVIDGYSHLSAEMRKDMRLVTSRVARTLSRERGARYYVDGAITSRGDSTEVTLRLHDVRGDSLIAQESASGDSTVRAPTLGLRAVARLLPRLLDPSRRIDVSDLLQRSPGALALWIQGEREYRQSRFAPALDLFRRALQEDSALGIAAVRGAQAASWESRLEEAEALSRTALALRPALSARHRAFAEGLHHYVQGKGDSAALVFERLIRLDSEGAEAPMALAEVYQHLLNGAASPPDSAPRRWLSESVRRDSGFTPPLFHLAQIAYRDGDADAGDALVETLRKRGADPALLRHLQLMSSCVRGDKVPWDVTAGVDAESVLAAAKELLAHFARPQCAEAALRAILRTPSSTPGVRWSALLHYQGLLVATRRNIELRALLDSTVAAGTSQARSLYIIDAVAGADRSLMRPKAEESAAFAQKAYGPAYAKASAQTRWVLGLWHALEGDTARLAAMGAVSDSVALLGGRRERLFAGAMRARLALARGDTGNAITLLAAIVPTARRDSLTYELFEPLAAERSLLALLLLARGDDRGAMNAASSLEHPQPAIYLPFLPLSLDIRARAADRLDRKEEALQYRARLRAIAEAGGSSR